MSSGLDPNLVNDFLTESGELIEQLDADLVRLETEPDAEGLLDQIFRALHTIKGAASFLNLPTITGFSHAAEDALNRLRKGEVAVDSEVSDALLRSVDVLRGMLEELAAGDAVSEGPAELVEVLHRIAGAESAADAGEAPGGGAEGGSGVAADAGPGGVELERFELPADKVDVLPFMVDDMNEAAAQLRKAAGSMSSADALAGAAQLLSEASDSMRSTAEFFGFARLSALVDVVAGLGDALSGGRGSSLDELAVRVEALSVLVEHHGACILEGAEPAWPLETLAARLETAAGGGTLEEGVAGAHGGDAERVLVLDGVFAEGAVEQGGVDGGSSEADGGGSGGESAAAAAAKRQEGDGRRDASQGEQTVRVEVSRLETLLNLVGEMVLTKNQVLGIGRSLRDTELPHELMEHVQTVVGDLDRLTSELQVGVMRTRMQPLSKLFGRYPRIVRDLARHTGKKIDLEVIGGDTEVDKSVLELLADPMVHILRNSADHGVEMPEARAAAGKPETGTIRVSAEHQGGHVRVEISDDGKGLSREVIATKAIERGIATAEQVEQMSDREVFKFIFAAGFSTASQVSDLSGRGVGMDVVRTNITRLGGAVNVDSTPGEGTSIEVVIPLTVAILPAMLVEVGDHEYAVPIASIVEIVKPEVERCHSVAGRDVMRLRDAVLPIVDLAGVLGERAVERTGEFALVVEAGQQRAGLRVDRLIGQQEVVIKPLDDTYTTGGPFSGATIREDGGVSLILDVLALVRADGTPSETAPVGAAA